MSLFNDKWLEDGLIADTATKVTKLNTALQCELLWGTVDHAVKTSCLDYIRARNRWNGEAGGITQHYWCLTVVKR